MTPNELAKKLEAIYGPELKSVVLYGSSVRSEFSKRYSDYNIICVLTDPSPEMLAKSNHVVKKWVKKGNPPPYFFDPRHIETSSDVFPLEFIDISNEHKVILGQDPFKQLDIDTKNLRHQCESELKGKLLHLRSFYAENCDAPRLVAEMCVKSFSTFLAVFRGVLMLLDKNPPRDARAIIELIAAEINFNPEIFLEIAQIRQGKSFLPRKEEAILMFERYLTELSIITNFVDRM